MDTTKLYETIGALLAEGKGILAMDESNSTCHKRFAKNNIPQTEESRRSYRELLITAPGLGDFISGAILFDETARQSTKEGKSFISLLNERGIIPGIKVDKGTSDLPGFPGEKVTEGLDGLRSRLQEYYQMGLRFAKWRAVIAITDENPTWGCIEANAHALARYAALCQESGLVPIVEPEVLMDGEHSLERCFEVTQKVLKILFDQLYWQHVDLKGILLKPNMVLPGKECPKQDDVETVASATVNCLLSSVPAIVPGIAFLSGGQSPELASARLNAMNKIAKNKPWVLTFSFSRAIQEPALEKWKGKEENVQEAQKALLHRAQCNSAARCGHYSE